MSGNTNTIDVLLIVDADYLQHAASNTGDAVFLLAQRSQVDVNAGKKGPAYQDGGNELWIDVKRNDVIRWRATTLSRNADTSVVITNVYVGDRQSGQVGEFSSIGLVTPAQTMVSYLKSPYNPPSAPNFATAPANISYWQATAGLPGTLPYKIDFFLLDQDGNYINEKPYTWDPFISIT